MYTLYIHSNICISIRLRRKLLSVYVFICTSDIHTCVYTILHACMTYATVCIELVVSTQCIYIGTVYEY